MEENGDITRVYIFSAIALFILLIACINYMNLSTARSVLRSKEIGIRKVVGAQRKEIIAQFLSESVLITALALLLAIIITAATLPLLNKLSGQDLTLQLLNKWYIVLPIILTPFIIGIFSGIYPCSLHVILSTYYGFKRNVQGAQHANIIEKGIGGGAICYLHHSYHKHRCCTEATKLYSNKRSRIR